MQPAFFEGTGAEDEITLYRKLKPEEYLPKVKAHRDTYITEEDFRVIAEHGMNLVRIPVLYFVFGDRGDLPGCISYLDSAFEWAEKYGLTLLIDLHTVPGSQNGYDNGDLPESVNGIKIQKKLKFALSVLERLAKRYAGRKGLFGIEVLNEPISFLVWLTSPSQTKTEDKEEAKRSWYVPLPFLKKFYKAAYKRIRKYLPEEKAVVFHDGFRLTSWNSFFDNSGMKNVNRHIPVITGERCLSNRYAVNEKNETERARRFREIAGIQMDVWNEGAGSL